MTAGSAEGAQMTALVTDTEFTDLTPERDVLTPIGCEVRLHGGGPDQLPAAVGSADALLVSRARIDEAVLRGAERVRAIARYGVGVDNIDVEYATSRGIAVLNVPDYCVEEVAEHVIALMFASVRHVVHLNRLVQGGRWSPGDIGYTRQITGSVLGLVGLGRIGASVARRGVALGMTVLAHDPYVAAMPPGVEAASLQDLLARADVVSMHAPLTSSTRGMIGAPELTAMKRTAVIVNASRGGLVDERALAEALRSGTIAAAALDVLEQEPPASDHPLLGLDEVLLTPHVGFYSEEAVIARQRSAAIGVRDALLGNDPEHVVNPLAVRS